MKKITTIAELIAEIENGAYNYYGMRGASAHDLEVMERGYLDCSQDNWDARDCEWHDDAEMLDGTSCIGIPETCPTAENVKRAYDEAAGYATNHHETGIVLLIADKSMEYGADDGEYVLGSNGCGADVVAIVELA